MTISGYTDHLVAYIDVLGFRQLIRDSETDQDLIPDIAAQLVQAMKWLGGFGLQGKFHAFNFSDNSVRATEVKEGDDICGHLNREIYYLAERQLQMAVRGWFIRGAISIGPLAVHANVIFGPALVRTHELESTLAVYPRIVVDPLLQARCAESGTPEWHDYLLTDQDGVTFVDYLFGAFLRRFSYPSESERDPWQALDDHRNACTKFLEGEVAKSDLRVRQKAVWTSNSHNRALQRLAERFAQREEAPRFAAYMVRHPFLL